MPLTIASRCASMDILAWCCVHVIQAQGSLVAGLYENFGSLVAGLYDNFAPSRVKMPPALEEPLPLIYNARVHSVHFVSFLVHFNCLAVCL